MEVRKGLACVYPLDFRAKGWMRQVEQTTWLKRAGPHVVKEEPAFTLSPASKAQAKSNVEFLQDFVSVPPMARLTSTWHIGQRSTTIHHETLFPSNLGRVTICPELIVFSWREHRSTSITEPIYFAIRAVLPCPQ